MITKFKLFEQNNTQILYHGTNNKFDEFNKDNKIFLTSNVELAKLYGKHIKKCLLKTTNIKEINATDGIWWKDVYHIVENAFKQLKIGRYDCVKMINTLDPFYYDENDTKIFSDIYVLINPEYIKIIN